MIFKSMWEMSSESGMVKLQSIEDGIKCFNCQLCTLLHVGLFLVYLLCQLSGGREFSFFLLSNIFGLLELTHL